MMLDKLYKERLEQAKQLLNDKKINANECNTLNLIASIEATNMTWDKFMDYLTKKGGKNGN